MKEEEMRKQGKKAIQFIQKMSKEIQKMPYIKRVDEKKILVGGSEFLKRELNVGEIEIIEEYKSDHQKAGASMPFKPAIIIE